MHFLYVIEQMGIPILKQIHIDKVEHQFQGFYSKKQYLVCILNTWPLWYQSHKRFEDKIIKGIEYEGCFVLSNWSHPIKQWNIIYSSSNLFFQTVHWLSTFYLNREDQGQRWLFYSIWLYRSIFCQVTEF